MFIDETYFVGELQIPNTDNENVASRIQWFIKKYEPKFLELIFGYPLYKAFVNGINVVAPATPDQRYLDLLYGCEYYDGANILQKWKGLIVTDSPIYNLSGGLVYRKPEYLIAGETPGVDVNADTAVFPSYIGWEPQFTRTNFMTPEIDYHFDSANGNFSLLRPGDKFGNGEKFKVDFNLRTDAEPVIDFGEKESIIAYYVYYWICRASATSSSGVGEVRYNPDGALIDNPNQKMAFAWNQLVERVEDFIWFMDRRNATTPQVYPESLYQHRCDALNTFRFINPIF